MTTPTKRYRPNSGWINVQLSPETDLKLREMVRDRRPRPTITALVDSAIEREWKEWKRMEDAR